MESPEDVAIQRGEAGEGAGIGWLVRDSGDLMTNEELNHHRCCSGEGFQSEEFHKSGTCVSMVEKRGCRLAALRDHGVDRI